MLYPLLFLVRYYPFWAIPVALVFFELGVYHFNRRARVSFSGAFGIAALLTITSIIWVVLEGYWRAGPFVKRLWDQMHF